MGRPREFDEAEVLDRAVQLFWHQGYDGTSLTQLLEHMGISRQSLYNTFGDKRSLFLRALERYCGTVVQEFLAILTGPDPGMKAIRTHFDSVAELSADCVRTDRRACLMTNAAVELAPHDPEVAALVQNYLSQMDGAFEHALRRAQEVGDLSEAADLQSLARYCSMATQGMLVWGKSGASLEDLKANVEHVMRALK